MALDGFMLNASIANQAGSWPWAAVERLRASIADPSQWRPRAYVVPVAGVTIPAESDFLEQIAITPGSLLWGIQFAPIVGTAANYLTQVHFDFDGTRLWSKPVQCTALQPRGAMKPKLLAVPRRLRGSAVSVRIWNRQSITGQVQMVLLCAEPWGAVNGGAVNGR